MTRLLLCRSTPACRGECNRQPHATQPLRRCRENLLLAPHNSKLFSSFSGILLSMLLALQLLPLWSLLALSGLERTAMALKKTLPILALGLWLATSIVPPGSAQPTLPEG